MTTCAIAIIARPKLNVGMNMKRYLMAYPIGSTIGFVKLLKPRQIQTAVVASNPKMEKINYCYKKYVRFCLNTMWLKWSRASCLPDMTPRMVITENPEAGVFAQKLKRYAIKMAGIP